MYPMRRPCPACQRVLPVQVHACLYCGETLPGRFVDLPSDPADPSSHVNARSQASVYVVPIVLMWVCACLCLLLWVPNRPCALLVDGAVWLLALGLIWSPVSVNRRHGLCVLTCKGVLTFLAVLGALAS